MRNNDKSLDRTNSEMPSQLPCIDNRNKAKSDSCLMDK